MGKKTKIKLPSEKKQERYTREARLQYGAEIVNESIALWNSYGKDKQEAIMAEGGDIYREAAEALDAGLSPHSDEVQAILQRWHEHLHYFYEPTLDILRGLGETYRNEPGFIKFFKKLHPGLHEYLADGIVHYVNELEHAEIERMLAEDEAQVSRANARLAQ